MELQADVTFYFQSESVRGAGDDLRRLADAAAEVGFELSGARVEKAPPQERRAGRGTFYVPLDSPATEAEG